MTRFLGLFGSNNGSRSDEEFYLDNDQAKTLGDIDYMRTSRQIKRTYTKYKSVDQGGMKVIKQVSATSDVGDDLKTVTPQSTFTPSTFTPSETSFNNSSNSSNGSTPPVDSEMEVTETVSTTSDVLEDDLKTATSQSTVTPSETSFNNSSNSSNGSNSSVDSSMDMFRKMAKGIKKPK